MDGYDISLNFQLPGIVQVYVIAVGHWYTYQHGAGSEVEPFPEPGPVARPPEGLSLGCRREFKVEFLGDLWN